jgi:hypothetical protein
MSVIEIEHGRNDASGAQIITVYARRPPDYAVYRTAERVVIHYSDDAALEKIQRTAMAQLNPVRGEINGLIDSWRTSKREQLNVNAKQYDRRVADALIACLEDDPVGAAAVLAAIKKDIVEERTSWARYQYLIVASITVVVVVALALFVANAFNISQVSRTICYATATGAVGAFFSIAIAIRSRTVLMDLRVRDNSADAILRIIIGSIAATLLICLAQSGAIDFRVGEATLQPDATAVSWLFVLIVAFLGGFSERLVPDLLGKFAAIATNGQAPQPAPVVSPTVAKPEMAVAAAGGGVAIHTVSDHANKVDSCLSDIAVQPGEATPDTELPAASGGVAARRQPA